MVGWTLILNPGHFSILILRKDKNIWVNNCIIYEVKGLDPSSTHVACMGH